MASGPAQEIIPGEPAALGLAWPAYGTRFEFAVGLKPYVPQQRAGMRIEPPMSVPGPD